MSRSFENNDEQNSILRNNTHQEDEIRNLFDSARQGNDQAQTRLLEDHSNLIKSIVASFRGRLSPSFDVETLEAEAQSALLKAVREIDLERLGEFVPYAKRVIRNDINELVRRNASNTRQQYENNRDYENMYVALTNKNRTEPTQEEVYGELEWGITKIRNHRRNRLAKTISLDQSEDSVGNKGTSQREGNRRPSDYISSRGLGCEVSLWASLEQLDPIQKRIIVSLHLTTPPKKLSAVAEAENLPVKRVKEIERRALIELKRIHEDEV